jgi:hypothetical protein
MAFTLHATVLSGRLLRTALLGAAAALLFCVAFEVIDLTESLRSRLLAAMAAVAFVGLMTKVQSRSHWPFLAWALPSASFIFTIAALIMTPSLELVGFARDYYGPFSQTLDFSGPLGNRVLSPLLAWMLFLRGDHFTLFVYGETFVFLVLLLWFFNQSFAGLAEGKRILFSVLGSTLLGFSGLAYFQVGEPSQPLMTSYILVLVFMLLARSHWPSRPYQRNGLKLAIYCLLAANHDSSILIYPFLALYAAQSLRFRPLLQESALFLPGIVLLLLLKATVVGFDATLPDGTTMAQDFRLNFDRAVLLLTSLDFYRFVLYPLAASFAAAWLVLGVHLFDRWLHKDQYTLALQLAGFAFPAALIFVAAGWARYLLLCFPVVLLSAVYLLPDRKYGPYLVATCAFLNSAGWYLYSRSLDLRWLSPP